MQLTYSGPFPTYLLIKKSLHTVIRIIKWSSISSSPIPANTFHLVCIYIYECLCVCACVRVWDFIPVFRNLVTYFSSYLNYLIIPVPHRFTWFNVTKYVPNIIMLYILVTYRVLRILLPSFRSGGVSFVAVDSGVWRSWATIAELFHYMQIFCAVSSIPFNVLPALCTCTIGCLRLNFFVHHNDKLSFSCNFVPIKLW